MGPRFAPTLLPVEAIDALRYSGSFADDSLVAASESLGAHGIELRSFVAPGAVASTANDLDVSVYDASYVALAETVGGRTYTADDLLVSVASTGQYAGRVAHVATYN